MSSALTDSVHRDWFQIAVEDPTSPTGQGFVDLLRIVTQHVDATIVAVCEVEGAVVARLKPKDNLPSLFPINDFLDKARAVRQFDWGDFYLCASEAQAQMLLVGESYHSSVPKASAVVGAVDDTYFTSTQGAKLYRRRLGTPMQTYQCDGVASWRWIFHGNRKTKINGGRIKHDSRKRNGMFVPFPAAYRRMI